ncbi:UDP-N-acetylglucosamine acyltransferase [Thorsellia kenyensis]|uniref:UDP-N-acetylglucosamine acyltransferase n=1 Tax=Thorsellia kenyensis TaxID=1549888 RepID=A0ABV6C7S3_9GAMM
MKQLALIFTMCLLLTGCQSVPPLNFSVESVQPSTNKIDAELKSITVSVATPAEKTGDIPQDIQIFNVPTLWKDSIEEALNRKTIFIDDAEKKVNLSVKILAMDIPSFGAEFKTIVTAKYDIIDRKSGEVLVNKTIQSEGIVPFDYAFLGAVRHQESINRAVKNNIMQFLTYLDSVKI